MVSSYPRHSSGNNGRRLASSRRVGPPSAARQRRPPRQTPKADPLTLPTTLAMPLNISFGTFDFQEMRNIGQRGGGVRELNSLLRSARRRDSEHGEMLRSSIGIEQRNDDLLTAAVRRAAGERVKDDPAKLSRALAKRRQKKRQSAKKWAKRIEALENSVENVVADRSTARQTKKAQKDAKQKAKEGRKAAFKKESDGIKSKYGSSKNKKDAKKSGKSGKSGKGGKGGWSGGGKGGKRGHK